MIDHELYSKIHMLMPIVCVDCVIIHDNKILLIKRKLEPMKNEWWFPGGRVLKLESLQNAISRIVKSETGLSIHSISRLGVDETIFNDDPFGHGCKTHTINIVFKAFISEIQIMKICLDDNHLAYSFFDPNTIYNGNFNKYIKKFTAMSV